MGHSTVPGTGSTAFRQNRWVQLAIGIVCMGLVANLQYAWTLFVVPMDNAHHWGQAGIQTAFTIFIVTETWLVPVEGWLVDKFGPRPVVTGGALCAAIGWMINAHASSLPELYIAAVIAGIGAGLCVRHLRRDGTQMVSGQARSRSRVDGGGLRRRRGGHGDSDCQHDPALG